MLDSFKHLVGKKTKEETQLKTYKDILEKNPNNVNIRLKLGDLYARLDDKKAAIKEYTTAAVQYADDGFLVKAIAVNKLIVRLDSTKKEALDRLSNLYFQRGVTADPLVQNYRESQQQDEAPETSEEEAPEISTADQEIDLAQEEAPAIPTDDHKIDFAVDSDESGSPVETDQDKVEDIASYVEQISLLSNLADENRDWLVKHSELRTFTANARVLQRGDDQESLYIILEGEVKIFTKDKEDQDSLLNTLSPGKFFGGTSAFAPVRQNEEEPPGEDVSVIAETDCTILEVPQSNLAMLIKKEPEFSEALLMEHYKRKASDVTLARVPLFSYLDPIERRKIAEQLTPMNVEEGAVIITEGELGDSMYIIKSGQVGVYTTLMQADGVSVIKTDQERLHLATLQEGDFFGEQALITKEPRSATTIAMTAVQLLKFTKRDLAVVVKQYPRVGSLLKKYHQQRISSTLESLKSIW